MQSRKALSSEQKKHLRTFRNFWSPLQPYPNVRLALAKFQSFQGHLLFLKKQLKDFSSVLKFTAIMRPALN